MHVLPYPQLQPNPAQSTTGAWTIITLGLAATQGLLLPAFIMAVSSYPY